MIEEEVKFKTSRGLKLAGALLSPDEKLRDVVVFAHGTGSSKASPRNRGIAERLLNHGIASFLFDFTGHGDSDGIPEQSTQDQQFDDLISAIDFLSAQTLVETRFVGVNGSSTGGTVAIRAAAEDPRVQVMVLRVPRSLGILQYAPDVRAPTLIIQGSEDKVVLPEAREIYESLTCPKELQIIKGAGHLFEEKPSYLRRMTELTCAWFEQWFAKLAETE
ncbi:MAG: lysophospholipase [Armatimonadetes bacterium]|nr:lysophospholipase [Armatimonadota bacterium]